MTHAEKVLSETSGEVEFNAAKKEQKVMCRFKRKKKIECLYDIKHNKAKSFCCHFYVFHPHLFNLFRFGGTYVIALVCS